MLSPNSQPRPGQPSSAADLRSLQRPVPQDVPVEVIPTLLAMQELFGAKLPADIAYEPVTVADAALAGMAFRSSYDEGYCGHFSIPGGAGAAAEFSQVMAQPEPLAFIEQHLTWGVPEISPEISPESSPESSPPPEWVIFSPGLNTLHAIKPGWEGETTTPQRLAEQYIPVLQTPMAQMHLGTDMDQGAAELPIAPPLGQLLADNRAQLEAAGLMPQLQANRARFDPRQRDRLEALLSQQGFARPLFQQHAIQLLKLNETAQRPMVWMVYSRATGEFSGALRQYLADYIARHPAQRVDEARRDAETLLRRLVTVVSLGNSDRNWPDGPAYVHFAAMSDRPEGGTDPLTQAYGVHARAPEGAGEAAVFVHVDGLFSGFDAHNFGAVGAAGLRLVMDLNGCQTYRQLWELGQVGPLRLPSLAQVAAKVVLTDGAAWLWEPSVAWTGVVLPSLPEAQQIIAALGRG